MQKKLITLVLVHLLLLFSFKSVPAGATEADSLMYLSDDARYYRLEEKSHHGHTVISDFTEITKNEFRLAVAQFCPREGYTVNDGILKFHLTINEETDITAGYVMYIDAVEGAYVIFSGTVYYDAPITSLRLVPEWEHGIQEEDTMFFIINLVI